MAHFIVAFLVIAFPPAQKLGSKIPGLETYRDGVYLSDYAVENIISYVEKPVKK